MQVDLSFCCTVIDLLRPLQTFKATYYENRHIILKTYLFLEEPHMVVYSSLIDADTVQSHILRH